MRTSPSMSAPPRGGGEGDLGTGDPSLLGGSPSRTPDPLACEGAGSVTGTWLNLLRRERVALKAALCSRRSLSVCTHTHRSTLPAL